MNTPVLSTIKQFVKRHDWCREGGLRYQIFHSKENGFDQCIVRIGSKILINEEAFFRWLDEKNGGKLNISEQA
jgi:hypothetical protein